MRTNSVLSMAAAGLSLLPIFATPGLAQTTAPQPAIVHMIYHDAAVTTQATSTIEDRHVLESAEVHGNKVKLVFNSNACEVYENGVQTNKGCNWGDIQGDLKVQSKYSTRVGAARSKNALTTTIAFDSPAKAVAFRNFMMSTQPPVLQVTAADVTRSPSSVDTTHLQSNNILLKQAGTTTYQTFDSYLSASLTQAQVPSEAQMMMTKVKMEADDSKEKASVYTNHSKDDGIATDANKPVLGPAALPAGHL